MQRVVLIDSRKLLLDLLGDCLSKSAEFELLGTAVTAADGWELIAVAKPDLVVTEFDLPDWCGLDILDRCDKLLPETRVIFLTDFWSDAVLEQSLQLGAAGYLLKGDGLEETRQKLLNPQGEKFVVSETLLPRLVWDHQLNTYRLRETQTLHGLNSRQLAVLRYLVRGMRVKDIAELLGASIASVESHKYRLMQQLQIKDRVLLTRFAMREGLTTV